MLEPLARLGYASKALIYVIIGGLAAGVVARRGGRVTDTSGALEVILKQPYGRTLLVVLGVGLCGYALWRFLDAISDPDGRGASPGALVVRIGTFIRGGIYGALGIEAFRLARGLSGSDGDEVTLWTARILDWPLGGWLVGIAGLVVAVYGVSEFVGALKLQIERTIDLSPVPRALRSTIVRVSRFGVGARGIIIASAGAFAVRAALRHDPSEAAGTRESVLELANAAPGRWLLAAIAAGFIAYGIDQVLHARCRRIRPVI